MTTIVTALGVRADGQEEEQAWDLMPIGDRPWLQHQIEHLVQYGQTDLTLILHHEPEAIERLLGDGQRWGARIHYRLAKDVEHPLACLRGLDFNGPLVVGSSLALAPPDLFGEGAASGYLSRAGKPLPWLRLTPDQLLESFKCSWPQLLSRWSPDQPSDWGDFRLQDGHDLLLCNQAFLHKQWPLQAQAREVEPGCWIGRDVVLHPTAKITPPCYIGPHCRVGRMVQLGPEAVVGSGSILEEHCSVVNSVISPGTYLGAGLELVEMTASPGMLRLADGEPLPVPDASLLGKTRPSLGWGLGIWQKGLAWTLMAGLAPLRWWGASGRRVQQPLRYVPGRLPDDSEVWQERVLDRCETGADSLRQHFWKVFLPGLPACARGQLAVVGLTPQTAQQLAGCPAHTRRRYLSRGPGLVSEALVQFGPLAPPQERELAEACQASQGQGRYSLQLLWRYLLDVLVDAPHP